MLVGFCVACGSIFFVMQPLWTSDAALVDALHPDGEAVWLVRRCGRANRAAHHRKGRVYYWEGLFRMTALRCSGLQVIAISNRGGPVASECYAEGPGLTGSLVQKAPAPPTPSAY